MSEEGVYLVVADETEEFPVALRYAARLAKVNHGHVAILHIIKVEDFQHWGDIEERMRKELRDNAEKFLWSAAENANTLNGVIPSLYLEEGNDIDVLVDIIDRDVNIQMLILAGVSGSAGPGPMVSHFSGKGLAKLRVPVVIVPSHLDPEKIDSIL
ncbi:MAG: universal stress protein [Micavibrio sp.]|nr:MAG: universal stress protein [Micavibrio sp.]